MGVPRKRHHRIFGPAAEERPRRAIPGPLTSWAWSASVTRCRAASEEFLPGILRGQPMKTFRIALLSAVLAGIAAPVFAGEKPVNLSLFTPISIAKESDAVTAFRFNLIYGKNTS